MKAIIKLSFWKLVIASVAIGILCHLVFNWSVWATALVINFIWFAEKYSRLLYIPAIAIIGWTVFTSYLPITASKSPWATLKTDLFFSKTVDSVQVKADLILEAEKNRQKNNLLGEYAILLKKGKVKEAKALMEGVDNLFYPKKVKEAKIASQPKTLQPPSAGQTSMNGDSIFTKGVYDIDVNGKTPFVIRIAASRTGCEKYSMRVKQPRDRNEGYDVLYADGTPPVHDAPGISTAFPNKQVPRFQLAASIPTTVELTVN